MKFKHKKILGIAIVIVLIISGGFIFKSFSNPEYLNNKVKTENNDRTKDKDNKVDYSPETKNRDNSWINGTPPELNGLVYYTYNYVGDTIGSLEFSGQSIIWYAGHAHELIKGENVKYKRLANNQYLFDYNEINEGKVAHKTQELITNGDTWKFGEMVFYKNKRTWFLATKPDWATQSDIERAKNYDLEETQDNSDSNQQNIDSGDQKANSNSNQKKTNQDIQQKSSNSNQKSDDTSTSN